MNEDKPFVRKAFVQHDDVIGARWWQDGLVAGQDRPDRRAALKGLAIAGGALAVIAAGGFGIYYVKNRELELEADSLELQKKEGWDVGQPSTEAESKKLAFPGASDTDVEGSQAWRAALPGLAAELAPAQQALAPYYVPTLFQSLATPSSQSLRDLLRPIHTTEMGVATERSKGLLALFEAVDWPKDTALLVDLPGPESVAVAAAVAERFEPVFTFDNWPHPVGVVPAHLTLAATLYHLPALRKAKAANAARPPAFILDGNRLNPYEDDASHFDNRHLAKLPTAQNLTALGVKHVLYLVPDARHREERDDLNTDFVELDKAGIDVKIVAMTDFSRLAADPGATAATGATHTHHYHYGGYGWAPLLFWHSYGWYTPMPRYAAGAPPMPATARPPGASYRPAPRPTMFASRTVGGMSGAGRSKPSGFGRVSYRASRDGRFAGASYGAGRHSRSGSFTRSRSSSSA